MIYEAHEITHLADLNAVDAAPDAPEEAPVRTGISEGPFNLQPPPSTTFTTISRCIFLLQPGHFLKGTPHHLAPSHADCKGASDDDEGAARSSVKVPSPRKEIIF